MASNSDQTLFVYSENPILDSEFPTGERDGGGTVTSITWNGITWNFDGPVTSGVFITGDPWFVDNGAQIISQSPVAVYDFSGTAGTPDSTGRNGSVLNPVTGVNTPFDGRVRNNTYSASEGVTYPITMVAGDALVTTISKTAGDLTDWSGNNIGSKVQLKTFGILTCLAATPDSDQFRPSPVDRTQTVYRESDIVGSLPALSSAGAPLPVHAGFGTVEYFTRGLERPWTHFGFDAFCRDINSADAQFSYHQQMGEFLSEACVMLCTDLATTLLQNLIIQHGIDSFHVATDPNSFRKGDSSTRCITPLITGQLLNNTAMLNINTPSLPFTSTRDSENFKFYADLPVNTPSIVVTPPLNWSGHLAQFTKGQNALDPYEQLDPLTEWLDLSDPGVQYGPQWKNESYRIGQDSEQHIGMALAGRILGLETAWNWPATFSYVQRWMIDADVVAEQITMMAGYVADGLGNPYEPNTVASQSSGSDFVDFFFASQWGL